MLELPITYEDFDGNERTDTFFFHLSQTSITEIVMGVLGFDAPKEVDVEEILKAIVARGNAAEIISTFQNFIRKSVGMKSADGVRFVQDPDFVNGFMESNAYQELFMRLMQDDEFRDKFFLGILPAKLAEKAVQARNQPHQYSDRELLEMDEEQFRRVAGTDPMGMSKEHLLIAMRRKGALT